MGIAIKERDRVGQAGLGHEMQGALARVSRARACMAAEEFDKLGTHGHVRRQRRQRVLRNHRGTAAAEAAQLRARQGKHVGTANHDRAGGEPGSGAGMAQKCARQRRLSRTGLAHEPQCFAPPEGQIYPVDRCRLAPGVVMIGDRKPRNPDMVAHPRASAPVMP